VTHFRLYEQGALYGLIYTFEKRGDGIALHAHAGALNIYRHNVIVLRGSVRVSGRDWKKSLAAGAIFDFEDAGCEHEIAALEDRTAILNLYLDGKPAGENLSPEEREGFFDMPLSMPLDI
jgi:hypothetical protein